MGYVRSSALVILCGDSDLRARITSNRSEGGSSDPLRVEINQMAECYSRDQGTGRQLEKRLFLQRGHCDDGVGAQ